MSINIHHLTIPGTVPLSPDQVGDEDTAQESRRILQLVGDAEVLFALGHPAADLAEKLAPLHQVSVGLGKLLDVADIFQIAEVILVIRMRHLVFFHFHPLS